MNYDVNYFIAKFEAIPEEKWLTRQFRDNRGNGCVMGHCDYDNYINGINERDALESLFKKHFDYSEDGLCNYWVEQAINNGDHPKYQQPTPKQRILAALYDIKKMQEPKIEKEYVVVLIDKEISTQSKEIITAN